MDVLQFAVTVILVTASGALAPGPLFFATITHGAGSGAKSGFIFSVAHTVVEFSLVMLLASGLLAVANLPVVQSIVGIAGGAVLISFGIIQIRNTLSSEYRQTPSIEKTKRNLLLIGLAFTGLNPFFIVWWLTVGANLILLALEFASIAGVLFMYICHVWMDYVWLTLISHLAKMGTNIVGLKWYRVTVAGLGVVLIYYGFRFLVASFS